VLQKLVSFPSPSASLLFRGSAVAASPPGISEKLEEMVSEMCPANKQARPSKRDSIRKDYCKG
jgi:hypothetical protein